MDDVAEHGCKDEEKVRAIRCFFKKAFCRHHCLFLFKQHAVADMNPLKGGYKGLVNLYGIFW